MSPTITAVHRVLRAVESLGNLAFGGNFGAAEEQKEFIAAARLGLHSRRAASSYKRPRSPDSNFGQHRGSNKETASRRPHVNRRSKSFPRTYVISDRSTDFSGQTVVELLNDVQIGDSRNEHPDSLTHGLIETLREQFRQLKINKVKVHNNDGAEQTIVTAVSEARDFVLASLTSTDLENTVADLAVHVTYTMQLLSPDAQILSEQSVADKSSPHDRAAASSRHINNAIDRIEPAEAVSFQTASVGRASRRIGEPMLPIGDRCTTPNHMIQNLASWPTNASDGLSTALSDYPYGLTFPSALLDQISVSGCGPPATVQ